MSSVAGPSRPSAQISHPPAPSTSGDSESTQQQQPQQEKGLDVGVLRELTRTALVEKLNEVGTAPQSCERGRRAVLGRRADLTQIQGAKTLVLDSVLAGPLGLITEVALLKVSPSLDCHSETQSC